VLNGDILEGELALVARRAVEDKEDTPESMSVK